MIAVEHQGQTRLLRAPFEWDDEGMGPCNNLPVTDDGSLMYSYWKPSLREWFGLVLGRAVRLCVIGSGHPPVAVDVTRIGR